MISRDAMMNFFKYNQLNKGAFQLKKIVVTRRTRRIVITRVESGALDFYAANRIQERFIGYETSSN